MDKKWYKSKTVWTAVVGGVLGAVQVAGVVIPAWVYTILASFGLYAIRDSVGLSK